MLSTATPLYLKYLGIILSQNGRMTSISGLMAHVFQVPQFVPSDAPFLYLGLELTMDLNYKHQIQRMTCNLREKQESLRASHASPCQTLTIVRTDSILASPTHVLSPPAPKLA